MRRCRASTATCLRRCGVWCAGFFRLPRTRGGARARNASLRHRRARSRARPRRDGHQRRARTHPATPPDPAHGRAARAFPWQPVRAARVLSDLLQALARPGLSRQADRGQHRGRRRRRGLSGQGHARWASMAFVRLEGWCDQAMSRRVFWRTSDVLVLPSHYEVLPLVILEALAHGVAVVCDPVGEIPSLLTRWRRRLLRGAWRRRRPRCRRCRSCCEEPELLERLGPQRPPAVRAAVLASRFFCQRRAHPPAPLRRRRASRRRRACARRRPRIDRRCQHHSQRRLPARGRVHRWRRRGRHLAGAVLVGQGPERHPARVRPARASTRRPRRSMPARSCDERLHSPPDKYRQRRMGGSTTIWGGRCMPFRLPSISRRAARCRTAAGRFRSMTCCPSTLKPTPWPKPGASATTPMTRSARPRRR